MAHLKPSPREDRNHAIIAVAASIGWCFLPNYPDIFYGQYGAIVFGLMAAGVGHWKNRNPWVWFALGSGLPSAYGLFSLV